MKTFQETLAQHHQDNPSAYDEYGRPFIDWGHGVGLVPHDPVSLHAWMELREHAGREEAARLRRRAALLERWPPEAAVWP